MSGGFKQTNEGTWFKRVDGDGSVRYFHMKDKGARAYVKVLNGNWYIMRGNINSQMDYAHGHGSRHDTLDGAKAALLITLAALT